MKTKNIIKPRTRGMSGMSGRYWLGLLHSSFFILHLSAAAATNDLSSVLQQGLFEEEANHNLEAAARAYQSVSAQFDKDRKLAATAIFRLGEVYRKQGKTNEATAQYERIVREFSDQPTLATLSWQNLVRMGREQQSSASNAESIDTSARVATARNQVVSVSAELDLLRSLTREEALLVVPRNHPNPVLTELLKQLGATEQKLAVLRKDWSSEHPEVVRVVAQVDTIRKQIDEQIRGSLMSLEVKLETAKAVLAQLERTSAASATSPGSSDGASTTTDDEEKEIRRIQAMIQNSPDLINAGAVPPIFPAVEAGYLKVVRFLLEHGADVNSQSQGETPLHVAAKHGQKAMAELLLSRGANVNAKNTSSNKVRWNRTPLHEAAEAGFQAVAEVLIANQADLNARDAEGHTPLHRAAERNRANLVVLLAPKMADINAEDSKGITVLGYVAAYGSVELVKALLDAKADVNAGKRDVPLLAAINSRQGIPVIELLLQRGAKPNQAGTATLRGKALGESGYTTETAPLRAAIERNESGIVKLLLQFKADANAVDEAGRTALSRAVGNTNIVKLLLEAKADPTLGTADSPLLLAVRADNAVLAEMLLRAGANPNQETECDILGRQLAHPGIPTPSFPGGRRGPIASPRFSTGQRGKSTPLQAAVLEDHPTMVKLLLQFRGDPKANDAEGLPLVLSALGDAEMLQALLAAGADANAVDSKDQPALITATRTANSAAVDLLLAHGAKTEVRGERGNTPLVLAIHGGCTKCVESLLAAGADVNAKIDTDWTPLHQAVWQGRKEIAAMLLAKGADPNVRNSEGKTPLDLTKPQPGVAGNMFLPGTEPRAKPEELAALLRQHGALDDLPDFTAIRVTRQGFEQPLLVFRADTNGWNRFTLIETLIAAERVPATASDSTFQGRLGQLILNTSGVGHFPFPDLARIIIHRPARNPGVKAREIKASMLNSSSALDCALDVALEFGDVVEIPERVHSLDETPSSLLDEVERELNRQAGPRRISVRVLRQPDGSAAPLVEASNADTNSAQTRLACLLKTVQLVIQGQATDITVFAPREGWLTSLLQRTEARPVLRSSSDLARVKVTRRAAASDQPREFVVDVSKSPPPSGDLWLNDGDAIEVPDKP